MFRKMITILKRILRKMRTRGRLTGRPKPRGVNIDKAFTVSGVKETGGFTYVLLIDFVGLALIKRIASDESEIKYHCRARQGESIDSFWTDPASHSDTGDTGYVWINEC